MPKAITYETVQDLAVTVVLRFQKGLEGYKPIYKKVAPVIKSNGASSTYPFADLPTMREWVGQRTINKLKEKKYNLVNKDWESTLEIPRTALEDDNTDFYASQAEGMGAEAESFIDERLSEAMITGFSTGLSYDGKPFFGSHGEGNTEFNNMQDGKGEPWFLIDNSKPMSAFFWQERKAFTMEKPANLSSQTFLNNTLLFGVYGRGEIGYGLPQLAYGSRADLTIKNFELAQKSILKVKKDNGKSVGVSPTMIIVGPDNYSKALRLFSGAYNTGGASNPYYNKVEVVLLRYLSAPVEEPAEEPDQTPTP